MYSDKLFKFRNGRFEDLLSDDLNIARGVANQMAGRSVACVDRKVDQNEFQSSDLFPRRFLFPFHLRGRVRLLCREQAATPSTWPTTPGETSAPTCS